MASRPRRPKIAGEKTYSCPHCGAMFPTATKEDQRRLRLHRILHVDDRRKRIWVPNELANREERPHIVAG